MPVTKAPEENTALCDIVKGSIPAPKCFISLRDKPVNPYYHIHTGLLEVPWFSQAGRVLTIKAAKVVAESTLAMSLCFKYIIFKRGGKKVQSVMKKGCVEICVCVYMYMHIYIYMYKTKINYDVAYNQSTAQ